MTLVQPIHQNCPECCSLLDVYIFHTDPIHHLSTDGVLSPAHTPNPEPTP